MLNCFSLSCYDEPVNCYHYATYKRSFLNLDLKTNENNNKEVLFYQKDIHCVHLRRSTYEKYINNRRSWIYWFACCPKNGQQISKYADSEFGRAYLCRKFG